MGFLDRFIRRPEEEQPATPATSSAPELLSDSAPTSSHSAEVLRDSVPDFAVPSSSDGGRFYNPYEGLNAAIDSRPLKAPFKLPSQPEFLFDEEAAVHRRSWSENLTFYTGMGYLSGAVIGGSRGAVAALQSSPAAVDTTRLKLNRLLNSTGKSGRSSGNALGVLGLFFASAESSIGYFTDHALPDYANSLLAGAATGALFRSPRGPRQAAAAGAVGLAGAAALVFARNTLSKSL